MTLAPSVTGLAPADATSRDSRRERLLALAESGLIFPLLAILVIAGIWLSARSFVEHEREQADTNARFAVTKQLETYESHLIRSVREIDLTLKILQQVQRQGGTVSLATLSQRGLLPPALFTVGYTDASGSVRESTRPLTSGRLLADDARTDGLGIRRLEEATVPGGTLLFTRPLLSAAGETLGTAFIAVEADYFVAAYEESVMGRRGALVLSDRDGAVLIHRYGTVIGNQDTSVMAAPAGAPAVTLLRSRFDGELRYVASSALFGYPLIATVGLSASERLAPAAAIGRSYLWQAAAATVAVALVCALLTYFSLLLARSRRRARNVRVAHAERVEYLAYHDALTGLPNRSLFSRQLISSLAVARREDHRLAVLFLDLDRFKQINDTLGHDTGDELLCQVAHRLRGSLREGDMVARLGGDEFVIVLPHLDSDHDAEQVARRALQTCAQPFMVGVHELRVTTSVGISLFPGDGQDEQTLTKNADIAMYHAKEAGKNNYQFFSQELNRNSLERLALESGLRMALVRNEFRLFYQAKRDLRSNRIAGAEALLRWQHPDLGLLAPNQFIPAAEETGLIVEIGKWVIREACQQGVAWRRQGMPPLSIAVNLSPRQFADEQLLPDVLRIIEETGANPAQLELEITESLLMRNIEQAVATLTALKAHGIRVAIDDFGTGYSSLSMLKQFPLDAVKIDRSFISDIGSAGSEADVALTEAIIAMGKALQLTVVAEGVESAEQDRFLREHACDQYQGFYLNVPAPAAEFAALLRGDGKLADTVDIPTGIAFKKNRCLPGTDARPA